MTRSSAVELTRWTFPLLLAGLAGCGGSATAPPPPPPPAAVASVGVTPPAANVSIGDSIALMATIKDANGNPVAGKSPTWKSSTEAVATVSASGLVKGVTEGMATISATVDGKSGSSTITVTLPPKVVLDAAHAATSSIGFLGGTITATTAGGLAYRLTVPRGALDQPVSITMTPLKAFNRLPMSGGFVGGVDFQPAGLTFRTPLVLEIDTAPLVPAGQRLVGFAFSTDGDTLRTEPAVAANNSVTLLITHFSGAGAGLATVQDLSQLPPAPNSSAQDTALIALSGLALPADQAAILAALRHWQLAIVARLQLVTTDVQARDARAEFAAWLDQLRQYPGPDGDALRGLLAPELATLRLTLAAALRVGIAFANQQCTAQQSVVAARNVLFLQSEAEVDSVATVGNLLDRRTVLNGLCVIPAVIDSLFPISPTANVPATLDLRVGLGFTQQAGALFLPFNLALDIHGTTSDRALNAATDAQGRFSISLTPSGSQSVRVPITACPDSVTFLFPYPCVAFVISRPLGRVIQGDVTVSDEAALQALNDVVKVTGNLTLAHNAAITSTDLSELGRLEEVGGRLSISAPALTTLAGLAHLASVGTLSLSTVPGITSLAPLHGVTYGGLVLQSMDGITTLADLIPLPSTISADFRLISNARLADAKAFKNVVSTTGSVDIAGNPDLASLSDFASLTTIGGTARFSGTGLADPDLTDLDQLQSVGGTLTISVNDVDDINIYSLSHLSSVGGSLLFEQIRFSQNPPRATPLTVQLPALTQIGGSIGAASPPILARVRRSAPPVAVNRLYTVTLLGLQSISNGSTVAIDNLAGLTSVTLGPAHVPATNGLEIFSNPDLQVITLGAMQITGSLQIDNNPALSSIELGDGIAVGLDVEIDLNGGAFDLRFDGEAQVGGNVEIDNNPGQRTIVFGGAFTITDNLEIDLCASLASITFAGGTVGGNLEIDQNHVLSSLTGPVASVGGDLDVDLNPQLSNQAATSWASSISVGGTKQINNNKNP